MKKYNVITWNFNRDNIDTYDIMPYLLRKFEEDIKRKKNYIFFKDNKIPETFEDYKYFVASASKYQFWARCEYEVIITGWPIQKNQRKIDVWYQIEQNLDIVTKVFMENIKLK